MRQQTRPSAVQELIWQNISQVVPESGLLICASKLQVLQVSFYKLIYNCFYKLNLNQNVVSVLISVPLCLTVIITVN
jgi:hypothetical protein